MDYLNSILREVNKQSTNQLLLNDSKVIVAILFAIATKNLNLWKFIYDEDQIDQDVLYHFNRLDMKEQISAIKLFSELGLKGVFGAVEEERVVKPSMILEMQAILQQRPDISAGELSSSIVDEIDKKNNKIQGILDTGGEDENK